MTVSGCGWGARDLRLCEFVCIDIEYVGIVEVCVSFLFACVVVPSKDDDRGPGQSS